jgi:hypothetical protein
MAMAALPFLVKADTLFIRAPGVERAEDTFFPGEKSLNIVVEGAYGFLTSGVVTLVLLPVLAVILYRMGHRIAGPLLALLTLGLFLSRMLGAPA